MCDVITSDGAIFDGGERNDFCSLDGASGDILQVCTPPCCQNRSSFRLTWATVIMVSVTCVVYKHHSSPSEKIHHRTSSVHDSSFCLFVVCCLFYFFLSDLEFNIHSSPHMSFVQIQTCHICPYTNDWLTLNSPNGESMVNWFKFDFRDWLH